MDFYTNGAGIFLGTVQLRVTKSTPKKISVIDTICGISGKPPTVARTMWGRIKDLCPEIGDKVDMFKFPGQGQRETPVATINNLVYIIGKIPGGVAQRLAQASAETLTRYLGGDKTLADEVHDIAALQAELAVSDPNHPARLFGEHAEANIADAVEWRTQRTLQKEAGAECANEIKASGFSSQRNHAHVNNRKNQSVIGFDIATAQFKREHGIDQRIALTEFMNKEQLSAHMFMSNVLKRKISETAPKSNNDLITCVDRESARMKGMFAELGVHKQELVHYERRIAAIERELAAAKAIEDARPKKQQKTLNILNFFGKVTVG